MPNHIILSNEVYKLSVSEVKDRRAFDRFLIDFAVEGKNPLNDSDKWTTLLGITTKELKNDYPSYNLDIFLEWILFRFLS